MVTSSRCPYGDPKCTCGGREWCLHGDGGAERCLACRAPVPHECPVTDVGDPVYWVDASFKPFFGDSSCMWCAAILDPKFVPHAPEVFVPNHRRDCPSITGVHPVVHWHFPEGLTCARCGEELPVDASYERMDGKTTGVPREEDVACLGCAAIIHCL